jgi:hypothetical protein
MQTHTKIRILGALLLTLAACGKMEPEADRGGLGRIGGGLDDSTNTTVQSSGSLSCSATPSATYVTYGQAITITVQVGGAQGGVTIDGTNISNVTGQTTFQFNSTFQGSGTANVSVPVRVRDNANVVTCSYRITLH